MRLIFKGHAIPVQMKLDGYFEILATLIARLCEKKAVEYTSSKETRQYQRYLEETEGIPTNTLIRVEHHGRGAATWIDERMAYDFAQWCSFDARKFVTEVFHALRVDGLVSLLAQDRPPHDVVMERMFRATNVDDAPTYPSDIPGVPFVAIPDEAEHALTHQLLRDGFGLMAGRLAEVLRELAASKDQLARLTEAQTEVLGMFAELVEVMRGKQRIPDVLRQSLYQAAWELNHRYCVGCGVALYHDDGRAIFGAMTLHHVYGLVSIASRLMPLCAFCNYHIERNVDLQAKVRNIEARWFRDLWRWSKAYPAIRDLWAMLVRQAREGARGQFRWLRWRHRGDHQHFDGEVRP